jgi:hypothetical protein
MNAEVIGGNDGPTSIMVVQGNLDFSIVPDLLGTICLVVLAINRKLLTKNRYLRVGGLCAMALWVMSVSKYALWLA